MVYTPSNLGLLPQETKKHTQKSTPIVVVKRKVGRPKKDDTRLVKKDSRLCEKIDVIKHRTKSGRIVKFSTEAAKIFQLDNLQREDKMTETSFPAIEDRPLNQGLKILQLQQQKSPKLLTGLTEPTKKQRRISSQFRCTRCGKVYLGKIKMEKHLEVRTIVASTISLFGILIFLLII